MGSKRVFFKFYGKIKFDMLLIFCMKLQQCKGLELPKTIGKSHIFCFQTETVLIDKNCFYCGYS